MRVGDAVTITIDCVAWSRLSGRLIRSTAYRIRDGIRRRVDGMMRSVLIQA